MRVLLLRPNSRMVLTPVPIGLGYVAGALRRGRGDRVAILDARNLRLSDAAVGERIRDLAPDAVGISATHADRREAHAAAALARRNAPRARIMMGGPYVSAAREAVLADHNVDVGVIGEGEATAVELLDAWDGGARDLSHVAGIVYRDRDSPRATAAREPIADLDSLDPAWDLLDPKAYFGFLSRNSQNRVKRDRRAVPVFSSRGCPYGCIFCHNVFGKKFRRRSAGSVVEEISMLAERYGVREIEFVDDCFNLDTDRAKDIFTRLASESRRIYFSFPNGLRGDKVDDELLDLFAATNVIRVAYAVESASPRVQELIKKRLDLHKVEAAISATARRGIATSGFFIMGFPTETAEEMRFTADFAVRSELHIADFFYLSPFPGTAVAEHAGADFRGVDFPDYSTIAVNLSAVPDQELHRINKEAYRRFYLDPRRIARIARVMPMNAYLVFNALLAARLFFLDSVAR